MTRGRRPKPTALKVLQGNPGKRPLNRKEPKPDVTKAAKPPVFLKGVARQTWMKFSPELGPLGLLANVDEMAFVGFCLAYQEVIECQKIIEKEGRIIQSPSGSLKSHPAVGQLRAALQQLRNFCSEFGLTPSSRSRIQVDIPGNGNVKESPEDTAFFAYRRGEDFSYKRE